MPTSDPGISDGAVAGARVRGRAPASRGFTLVEILVVMVILAIGGAVAVASIARDERGIAAREARRFAGALEYAAARAQARAETLGVSAEGRVVRFWRRDDVTNRWSPVSDDDTLGTRTLPESFQAAPLTYAGQRVAENAIVPLKASGRNEPFVFIIVSPAFRVALASDPLNRVAIDGPSPTAP